MQRQFVSDVSHELRTPLTTVRMAADLLYEAREDFDPVAAPVGRAAAEPAGPVRVAAGRPAGDQPVTTRARPPWTPTSWTCATWCGARSTTPSRWPSGTAAGSSSRLPAEPLHRRGRPPPGRAHPAQPAGQRHRARRGQGRRGHRRPPTGDAVAVAVRDHGVGLKPGEEQHGLRPVLAGRPGPRPHHRRHRAWAWPSRWRTPACTAAGCRRGASRGEGSQFRLTLPRVGRGRADAARRCRSGRTRPRSPPPIWARAPVPRPRSPG